MAKKIILGLAVVGGGLYYYDQNIGPIFPRAETEKIKQQAIKWGKVAEPAPEVKAEFRKLDTKAREFSTQLKNTVSELAEGLKKKAEAIRKQADSTVDSVKKSDDYKEWSQKLENYSDDVKRAAEAIEEKPLPNRLAAKYIEFVNSIGQTDDEKLRELQSAPSHRQQELRDELAASNKSWSSWWSGKKAEAHHTADKFAQNAANEKNSWLKWGNAKANEAQAKTESTKKDLEREKKSWFSWGSSKADEAERKAQAEKEKWLSWGSSKADVAEKEKDKWINWGSAKADEATRNARSTKSELQANYEQQKKEISDNVEVGKQRATEEYYRARKTLEDLTNAASEKASNLLGKGKVEDEKADYHLQRAKEDFKSALANLRKYGGDLVDLADKKR